MRLTSSRGSEGFGEASPWPVFTGTAEANFAALDRYLRPHVVGSRLGDWRDTMSVAQLAVVHCQEAKAALETAFLDLAGKTLEQPAWALLGVKCRDKIPLSVSLANPNFEEDLALVERLVEDEIGIVKIKTGFDSHAFDMMRLTELRKRFPNLDIGLITTRVCPSTKRSVAFRTSIHSSPPLSSNPLEPTNTTAWRRFEKGLERLARR